MEKLYQTILLFFKRFKNVEKFIKNVTTRFQDCKKEKYPNKVYGTRMKNSANNKVFERINMYIYGPINTSDFHHDNGDQNEKYMY